MTLKEFRAMMKLMEARPLGDIRGSDYYGYDNSHNYENKDGTDLWVWRAGRVYFYPDDDSPLDRVLYIDVPRKPRAGNHAAQRKEKQQTWQRKGK